MIQSVAVNTICLKKEKGRCTQLLERTSGAFQKSLIYSLIQGAKAQIDVLNARYSESLGVVWCVLGEMRLTFLHVEKLLIE